MSEPELIQERLVRGVRQRLEEGKQVRRTLPGGGRLAVDRPLPFLGVHRRPSRSGDHATPRLVTSEASYLACTSARSQREGLRQLATAVAEVQAARFGSFLVLEVWAGSRSQGADTAAPGPAVPRFRVHAPKAGHEALTASLEEALGRIRIGAQEAEVATSAGARRWPRGLPPILPAADAERIGCVFYGLEVDPIYLDPGSGEPYPMLLRELRRKLSVALRAFFFEFARSSTSADPAHLHALGRRSVVKAVWEVDGALAAISESFQFLLQITPVNGEQAWHQFKRSRFERAPALRYRPLAIDPVVLKRRLYKAPVERIEDPSLALIFRQKLEELDRQITMLQERNTSRFLQESIQLYGGVEASLHTLALDVLERIPPRSREERSVGFLDAEGFARRAREEIEYLRSQGSEVPATVEVRDDVTGLMVSRGNLLLSASTRIPTSRVEALVQHEVGTHVLTYHNGRAQRFKLLSSGLAGYDSLQEGLAVLAEFIVGGLSRPRLRLLAGRVVAARCLLDGSGFMDTFRVLRDKHGFAKRTAFTVAVRIHRGGGLTKDAVYLLGLRQILEYLGAGGELKPLFVGKIAVEHIPIVRELTWRRVLESPPLLPRYLHQPHTSERLEKLRRGVTVVDLLERRGR